MFGWLLDPLGFALFVIPWSLFVGVPFLLIKYIINGIEVIGTILPKLLLFGAHEPTWDHLPELFLRATIIAFAFWLLFFVVVLVRYWFQNAEVGIKAVQTALKYSYICWIYIWLIPLGIFMLYLLVDQVFGWIGASASNSVADMMFMAIKPTDVAKSAWQTIIANNFFLSLASFKSIGGWSNLATLAIHSLLGLLLAGGMLLAYFYAALLIMQKVFDQVFLFAIAPVIATTSVLDGGKRIGLWRDMMISKALVVFGTVVGSRLFVGFLGTTIDNIALLTGIEAPSDHVTFIANMPNLIVVLLVAVGGAFAFSEFGHLLAAFTGEGASLKESFAQTKTLIGAFSTTGAIGLAGHALSQGVNFVGLKSGLKNRRGGPGASASVAAFQRQAGLPEVNSGEAAPAPPSWRPGWWTRWNPLFVANWLQAGRSIQELKIHHQLQRAQRDYHQQLNLATRRRDQELKAVFANKQLSPYDQELQAAQINRKAAASDQILRQRWAKTHRALQAELAELQRPAPPPDPTDDDQPPPPGVAAA